jgi:hypothetical protein
MTVRLPFAIAGTTTTVTATVCLTETNSPTWFRDLQASVDSGSQWVSIALPTQTHWITAGQWPNIW